MLLPLLAVPAPRSLPRRAGPAPAASRGSPRLPAWQVGAWGHAADRGSPGPEQELRLPRGQTGRARTAPAPGSQSPKFGVGSPQLPGAFELRHAGSATHLGMSAARRSAGTRATSEAALRPLPHLSSPTLCGSAGTRVRSVARREGCGSQRPGLQPVAESAGTLNYIDQSVFLPRSAEDWPCKVLGSSLTSML